ncbi:acetylornithine transaminase [Malassezia sp. CBS 17886]|nr:acetylornithine transaminase [Malassezia sp. CBS 17886]
MTEATPLYAVAGYGTNLEGPISVVWRALERCHEAVHAMGVDRIATDIRLGTRTDKPAPRAHVDEPPRALTENQRKKASVERRLSTGKEACARYLKETHPDFVDAPQDSRVAQQLQRFSETTLGTYVRPQVVFSHGKGLSLYAAVPVPRGAGEESRQYLDFSAGIAVNSLGHADDQVAQIAGEQAATLVHCSNLFHNSWSGEMVDRLVALTREHGGLGVAPGSGAPSDGENLRAFVCNSGTEANEGALKFARKIAHMQDKRKSALVSFHNAFHGRTMGALSVTPNPKYQAPFAPLVGDTRAGELNQYEGLDALIDESVAGVIVEPIQGEGGVCPADVDWLAAVRARCDEVGATLIYDEIQCGLFRTGTMWCHSHFPLAAHPHIVTMAKPLANGFPIGAVLMQPHVAKGIVAGDHGTTFGGGPLACRIAHHVLGRLSDPALRANVDAQSTHLRARLRRITELFGDLVDAETSPRGHGLLLGVSMRTPEHAGRVVFLARQRGLLILSAGSDTLRFVPSLTLSAEHVDAAMDILESCLLVLRAEAQEQAKSTPRAVHA